VDLRSGGRTIIEPARQSAHQLRDLLKTSPLKICTSRLISAVRTVCRPLTTQIKNYPFEVFIAGTPANAVVADQVKAGSAAAGAPRQTSCLAGATRLSAREAAGANRVMAGLIWSSPGQKP
jgi:hypothetical protein